MKIRKTEDVGDLAAWVKERARNYRGPKEKTDHDLIAYGVSRDGTTLEEYEEKMRKKTGKKK